jgi:hypothetical protein
MKAQKLILKQQIADKLIAGRLFWSYDSVNSSDIPDHVLIEKVLIHLDIDDIDNLFHIFPWKKIKEVWLKEVVIHDSLYHSMNILLAFLYFHIRKPEAFIEKHVRRFQIS